MFFSLVSLGAAAQGGQGSRQSIKGHDLDKFSAVSLSGRLNVEIIPSGKDSISITLYDTELDKLKWNVSKDVLSVTLKPLPAGKGGADVKIYLAQPPLTLISAGADVLIREKMKSLTCAMTISNGAKLTAAIDCTDFELSISGASIAAITGAAKYCTITAWESSKVDCRALESVSASVEASTGAEVFIWASERAVLAAKTGATIFYRGNPAVLKQSISKVGLGASINNIGK